MKFGLVLLSFVLGAAAAPAPAAGGRVNFGGGGVVISRAQPGRPVARAQPDCANMKKLADGINLNIQVQHEELDALARVKRAVSGGAASAADFVVAKAALLNRITAGRRVREYNQGIPGAPASVTKGLLTVTKKQAEEQHLAEGLTGVAADLSTIDTLEKMFTGGIALNQQNAQEALQGCPGK